MPETIIRKCLRELDDTGLTDELEQLENSGQGILLHQIDRELGSYWHSYIYDAHTNNKNGDLLAHENAATKSAINIFVTLAAHWLTPNHQNGDTGERKISALHLANRSDRRVPGWLKEAFSIYQEHYNSMRKYYKELPITMQAGRRPPAPPELTFETTDPIAHRALNLLKEQFSKNKYDFQTTRKQAKEMRQRVHRPTHATQPVPAIATVAPLLTNPLFNPIVMPNGYRGCSARTQGPRRRF